LKYSKLIIPTTKEIPAEAEIASHKLMIRAGYIRKLASGTYIYLAMGVRSLQKIVRIVREEMNNSGGQEILMPLLQPVELWEQTGRKDDYGDTLATHLDRHGRVNVLAPTAEEVVTSLVSSEISSHKQLPVNLYQISTKIRDEFRPRFGALRSREFIMKDAYSFDINREGLDRSYRAMHEAYCRIFDRCGLPYVTVDAASGEIGGSGSQEFMVPCDAGEDIILSSDRNNYSANIEKAATGHREHDFEAKPAGDLEKVYTPEMKTIEEVSGFMKVKPANMLKTLVFKQEDAWVIAVIRGDHELSEEKLNIAAGGNCVGDIEAQVEEAGFPIGFVGPHIATGRKDVSVIVDPDAARGDFWAAGANEKDHHVKYFNWKRELLDPLDEAAGDKVMVADIRKAMDGDPSPINDGGMLRESRGIEVGHIFKLGTKYSKALKATVLDENGNQVPCEMGCYGIGINRILASAIEAGHDKNGIILPIAIAPFEIEIISLNNDQENVRTAAEKIYNGLLEAKAEVLLDDRDVRPGVKFKDADLIGIPLKLVIGKKGLENGNIEIQTRKNGKTDHISVEKAVEHAMAVLNKLKNKNEN